MLNLKEINIRKKNIIIITIVFLFIPNCFSDVLAECPSPVEDIYTAVDVSYEEVKGCIDDALAGNGGTVNIPSGNATWNLSLATTITKDLVIQGAGTDETIIDSYPYPSACTTWQAGEAISTTGYSNCRKPSSWNGCYAFAWTTGTTGQTEPVWPTGNCSGYQVADGTMTWYLVYVPQGISLKADGEISITLKDLKFKSVQNGNGVVGVSGTSPNHIIKNFEIETYGGRGLFLGSSLDATPGGGVVSGCTLTNTSNPATGQLMTVRGNEAGDNFYWQGNPKFGLENNGTYYYIEGCDFNSLYGVADNVPDAYSGARFVMRYNNFNGSFPGWHGNDSSSSGHSAEIYKNLFRNKVGAAAGRIVSLRGGTGLIWGNETDNTYVNGLLLSLYRACQPLGRDAHRCDGGGMYDQNSDVGYRCYQQPGSTGNDGLTQWPIIAWDNIVNGSSSVRFESNVNFIGANCASYGRTDGLDQNYYVRECRDYLNYDSCEIGGACYGQAICDTWWDLENGKAKLNGNVYTPYTCPHPLSGSTGSCDESIAGIEGYNVENTGQVIRADVDDSSEVATTDALLTLRNSLGLSMTGTAWQVSSTTGDVNCDGNSNSTDALLILRYSLGLSMSETGWCE